MMGLTRANKLYESKQIILGFSLMFPQMELWDSNDCREGLSSEMIIIRLNMDFFTYNVLTIITVCIL